MSHTNPPKATPPSIDTIKEKLAAIEHERWADWQKWMHSKMTFQGIGYSLPADLYQRWERQIATKYADLPAHEKASDLEQVERYWPLILTLFESIMLEVIGEDGKYTNPLSETGFLQGRDDMKTYYQNELRAEQHTKAAAALERLRNG